MTKTSDKSEQQSSSSVTIVDGKLILSLPDAKMPVVWQTDFTQAQSSVFTIQEDKKKTFTLISKNSENVVIEIATFDKKQDAVDILMDTSAVIQNAHGQTKQSPSNNIPAQSVEKNDRTSAALALALIIVLGLIWTMSASKKLDPSANTASSNSTSLNSASSTNPRESSGVPVSADDFLSNR